MEIVEFVRLGFHEFSGSGVRDIGSLRAGSIGHKGVLELASLGVRQLRSGNICNTLPTLVEIGWVSWDGFNAHPHNSAATMSQGSPTQFCKRANPDF